MRASSMSACCRSLSRPKAPCCRAQIVPGSALLDADLLCLLFGRLGLWEAHCQDAVGKTGLGLCAVGPVRNLHGPLDGAVTALGHVVPAALLALLGLLLLLALDGQGSAREAVTFDQSG